MCASPLPGMAVPGRGCGGIVPLPEGRRPPFAGDERLPGEVSSAGRARRLSVRQEVRRVGGLPARPPFSGGGRTEPVQPAAASPGPPGSWRGKWGRKRFSPPLSVTYYSNFKGKSSGKLSQNFGISLCGFAEIAHFLPIMMSYHASVVCEQTMRSYQFFAVFGNTVRAGKTNGPLPAEAGRGPCAPSPGDRGQSSPRASATR